MNDDHRRGDHVPEELLADLVDGTISDADRRRVEPHLQSCSTCRQEVELASRSVDALAGLPELEVPWSVTRPVIQEAGAGRRRRARGDRVTRIAWAAGTAAAAAVIGVLVWVGLEGAGDSGEAAGPAARTTVEDADGAGAEVASPDETSPGGRGTARLDVERQPSLNYGVEDVERLADEVAGSADALGRDSFNAPDGAGPPVPTPTGTATEETAPTEAPTPAEATFAKALDPLGCVLRAASVPSDANAVRVIVTRFQTRPAYIGAFVEGRPPDRVTVLVAGRPRCDLLHHTTRPVP